MERTLFLLLLFLSLSYNGWGSSKDDSLYDVLGVSRKADQRQIRAAYKRLAREWHPDKNKSPLAKEKILEINKAYEVLSGDESRRRYDMTGETDPAPPKAQGHAHNQGFTFFQSGNGHFTFHFGGGFGHSAQERKDTITTQYFHNTVLPESSGRLWLLNFFSAFCMQCGEVARMWDEIREEMESYGVGMGSVDVSYQHGIASYCAIDRVPAIAAVVNKRVFHYYGHLQARSIRNFVKTTIPSWIITEVNSRNFDSFISDAIKLNKPRLILCSPHPQPSLLYKAVAFANQRTADFGFVSTEITSGNDRVFLKTLDVSQRMKKLLVFKEYPDPSITIEEPQLTADVLKSIAQTVRLHLPRLSSPRTMEDTCGSNGRLCLVLVVSGLSAYNDSITSGFRTQAIELLNTATDKPTSSMAYIDEEKQWQFVSSFERTQQRNERVCANGVKARSVLLLRMKTGFQTQYDWYNNYCGVGDEDLFAFAGQTNLGKSTEAPELEDEFSPGVLGRMWIGLTTMWYLVYDYLTANSRMLSLLTMTFGMATLLCCVNLIGASQSPEEQERRRQVSQALSALVPTLNTQLYNQNVENAAKGSIVVLFLTNNVDKESLLRLFPKLIGKYIINRHIKFFRGSFETKRAWLEELLRECNMDPQELERRRCVYDELRIEQHFPVVCTLALFGAKKQFSIFPEMGSGHSRLNGLSTSEPVASAANQNASKEENSRNTGVMDTVMNSFGFEDGKTSDSRGFNSALSLWMERLEDGSLRRYSINHWPQWHQ